MKKEHKTSLYKRLYGRNGMVLLYLTACALNDTVPDKRVYIGADHKILYLGARNHNIESMIASALEKNGYAGIDIEIADKFRTDKNKVVRKNMLVNAERETILAYMEHEGIKYLPLKGIVLQELYPKFGMRQMSDNDILYDDRYQKKLKRYMTGRGFLEKNIDIGVHDCYIKPPFYNFEMHSRLFKDIYTVESEYYSGVWSMAKRDTDKKYGYHFTCEDCYVYVVAHAAMHYERSGTGIRSLADIYVLNRAYKGMNRSYIREQLCKLGITDFECTMRKLAVKLLSEPHKTVAGYSSLRERNMSELKVILTSGTYGIKENQVKNHMKKMTGNNGKVTAGVKLRYCASRVFPGQKKLLSLNYMLAKYKLLIPFIWLFRILRGLTFRIGQVFEEMRIVIKGR